MFNTRNTVTGLVVLGLCLGQALLAQNTELQPKGNSPYSRFGLGDPAALPFAAQNAMAGLSAAFHDPFFMNMVNPAALSHLAATDLETGLFAKYSRLSDGNNADNLWSGNLNYFALGFPLLNPINRALDKKSNDLGLGMGLVLQPFTTMGYDLSTEQTFPEVGTARTTFKGTGGAYRFMWGNAIRYKRLAAGANIGYLFGKLSYNRTVEFADIGPTSYYTIYLDEQSVSGFQWNAGAMWTAPLQKKADGSNRSLREKNLIFGLYGNSATTLRTNDSRFYVRDNQAYNVTDTLVFENNIRNTGTLPGEYAFGVTYDHTGKLKLGIEYGVGLWSQYRNPLRNEQLADTRRIALGLEYIPDLYSYNNYWQRVRYRAGAYYRTDPRTINGRQLSDLGLSLGMGLPVILPRQQTSFINFTLEGGSLGTAQALRETYIRMTLGFTLNDNSWFFKRKFN